MKFVYFILWTVSALYDLEAMVLSSQVKTTTRCTIYTYMYVSVVLVVLVDFPHVAFSQMVIPERDPWTKLDT